MEEEIWSPVELVLESRLEPKLAGDFSGAASPEGAAKAAQKVKGSWKTYYALRKSSFGMGFAGLPPLMQKFRSGAPGGNVRIEKSGGTNVNQAVGHGPSGEDLSEMVRRQRLEELGTLTPEQRVLQARERQALKQK